MGADGEGVTDRQMPGSLLEISLPLGKCRVSARGEGGGRLPLPSAATYEEALGTKKSTAKPK